MCGIIGYTGTNEAKDILLDALEMLEYRGYDSAGTAMTDADTGQIRLFKRAGRVKDLRKLCAAKTPHALCGIGHTRWATHGGVSDANAHPHSVGNVTLVHNGIIENYQELIQKYALEPYLQSETDSEAAAALLHYFYKGDPGEAIRQTVAELKGTFALVILFRDQPGRIYSIRNVSPIVASYNKEGAMLASDVAALCRFTNRYFVVPEYHILELRQDGIRLSGLNGNSVEPEYMEVNWSIDSSSKGGFPFYMEKEIMEQPEAIRKTIAGRIVNGLPDFTEDGVPDGIFRECERICIVACGTAMHAGLVGQALVKSLLHMHIEVELASEFLYSDPVVGEGTLVIAVSQSGETIDTLEALKYARRKGARSLSVINVKGSSIARESEYVIYTDAGPEVAVASTKAYTTQLSIFYLMVARMAYLKGIMTEAEVKAFIGELARVPEVMERVLEKRRDIHLIAGRVLEAKDLFMIGRGLDYFALLEGSLKMKEISYIHSEAYASGELKHGPIALITEHTPVVALMTQSKIMQKELSNIREVKARGADLLLFVKESLAEKLEQEFEVFRLPDMQDPFMVLPASAALQFLAYYVSADKGFDVDKPRNLAKVVTVE